MSPAQIQIQFEQLLVKGSQGVALRKRIGMPSNRACWYRYQLQRKQVGIATMIKWLKAAGVDVGTHQSYSAGDMQAFAKFCEGERQAAGKALGYAYLLEKWEIIQKK